MSTALHPDRPSAAIVGAGLTGRWHADAARRAGARVEAVVDPDAGRARELARSAEARAAESLDAVDLGTIDVVHVCSPPDTHAELAARILEAGCHTLVERPLAPTAAGTEALLDLAETNERLLCPVHQYLFQRGVLATAERLPGMGRVVHVEATLCTAGAAGEGPRDRDRLAANVVLHPLSLLARLFDWPLERLEWRASRPVPGELRAAATTPGGTSIALTISTAARPTIHTLDVLAETGTARLDLFHGFAVFEGGRVSRVHKAARPFALAGRTLLAGGLNLARRAAARETAFPGLRALVGAFYDAVEAGPGPGPIPPAETLRVARARDAVLDRIGRS